jgi:cyclopropane fatty-acyl-phospholipid synthase-like methyltransferase
MKNYNTTDLDPQTTFERHVFHRDQFAHYLRWTHILKESKINDTVVDFGCGKGNLLEVLYRNRFKCKRFIGLDIRKKTIEQAKEKFQVVDWAEFYDQDLIYPTIDLNFNADKVCSFEVAEHIGKQNIESFLINFKACGHSEAKYYLSTPNYDEKVGAAGNHTYDSGDGRGVAIHEFAHSELQEHIEKHFTIVKKFGTFASVKDYKPRLSDWQVKMYNALNEYYDSNLLSNLMAPMFPEHSRNTLWVLKQK